MFYLVQFFSNIKKNPGIFILFSVVTISLLMGMNLKDKINETFYGKSNTHDLPYFHVLLSSRESSGRLQRKVGQLPGVQRVELLGEKIIQKKVGELVSKTNLLIDKDLLELNYTGLKIVISPNLKPRSIMLIKNYMKRLVGNESLTLGRVHGLKKKIIEKPVYQRYIAEFFLTALFFIWLILSYLFQKELRKDGYLIEQFQRKNYVGIKMYFAGVLTLVIIGFLINGIVGFQQLGLISGLSFIMMSFNIFYFRSRIWQH